MCKYEHVLTIGKAIHTPRGDKCPQKTHLINAPLLPSLLFYLVRVDDIEYDDPITGFSSEIGTKLRDWAVRQAGACFCS